MNMGYGYTVAGVANWTVTGNMDQSRHVGRVQPGCEGRNAAPPAGYQVQTATASTLQPGFTAGYVTSVLNVIEPAILRLPVRPPAACGVLEPDEWLGPDQQLVSCDGRFRLMLQSDGNLVLSQGTLPIWSAHTFGPNRVMAIMQSDGNFVVYDSAAFPFFATNTLVPRSRLFVQNDGNVVIYDPLWRPLWATNTGGR
jgi:hypothetical protein